MFIIISFIMHAVLSDKLKIEDNGFLITLIVIATILWTLDIIISIIILIREIKRIYYNKYRRCLLGLIRHNLTVPMDIYNKTVMNYPMCVVMTILDWLFCDLCYSLLIIADLIYLIAHAGRIKF